MHLQDLWFAALAVLWIGYFFLEGFDFGVGVLTRVLARTSRTGASCSPRSRRSGTATRCG